MLPTRLETFWMGAAMKSKGGKIGENTNSIMKILRRRVVTS